MGTTSRVHRQVDRLFEHPMQICAIQGTPNASVFMPRMKRLSLSMHSWLAFEKFHWFLLLVMCRRPGPVLFYRFVYIFSTFTWQSDTVTSVNNWWLQLSWQITHNCDRFLHCAFALILHVKSGDFPPSPHTPTYNTSLWHGNEFEISHSWATLV